MNILLLTNEYPPHIYGGAGVHVDHLCRELNGCNPNRNRLQVLCFGDQRTDNPHKKVTGIGPGQVLNASDPQRAKLLDVLYRNVVMSGSVDGADVVHCHTWYTHLAGCLLKQILNIPLVVTTHSLEPHRPWKKEQLGNGYYVAGWLEKTALLSADAVIAVSRAMKDDIRHLFGLPSAKVHVIHNGIDAGIYRKTPNPSVLAAYGIDPRRPFILFVGRVTRQKGIVHLLNALHHVESRFQTVLCTGSADSPKIAAEVEAAIEDLRINTANDIIRIDDMVPVDRLVVLYSHADLFVCPSVYEPFGIINLEAMACETPVVASAVGGIPEVVVHEETGLQVPFDAIGADDAEPNDPQQFALDLASAIDALMQAPDMRAAMGKAARQRVETFFSWGQIARRTLELYETVTAQQSLGNGQWSGVYRSLG